MEEKTIDLNGTPISIALLARIVTALELYGSVRIVNAKKEDDPGLAALLLGACIGNDSVTGSIQL